MKLFIHFVFLLFNCVVFAQQGPYSLSSLDTTQVTDLSSACDTVYTTNLTGCAPSDFIPTNPCSSSCINTLTDIQTMAQAACAGGNIPSSSVLSFFTNGQGVNELCTVQKSAAPTTFVISVMPATATSTSSNSVPTSSAGTAQSTVGAQSEVSAPHPNATVIAIVVVLVVVISVLAVVGTVLFRKYYK